MKCRCGGDTIVTNTRERVSRNVIWRQRRCKACNKKFSTVEEVGSESTVAARAEHAARLLHDAVSAARQVLAEIEALRPRSND